MRLGFWRAVLIAMMSVASAAAEVAPPPAQAADEPRPFDETANANQEIDAALLAAKASGRNVALIFGGNWCHDSRGLAGKMEIEPLRSLIEAHYQVVWIDVGRRDRNLDAVRRFGVEELLGTPTIIILSPQGELMNADSVHDWRTADSRTQEETYAYFSSFVRTAD